VRSLGLRAPGPSVTSCPTCGRTRVDVRRVAEEVESALERYQREHANVKLPHVAVMGCAVNGPGEAKEADIGIAGGIGEGLLIKKGEIIKKVPEDQLLNVLKEELDHWVQ